MGFSWTGCPKPGPSEPSQSDSLCLACTNWVKALEVWLAWWGGAGICSHCLNLSDKSRQERAEVTRQHALEETWPTGRGAGTCTVTCVEEARAMTGERGRRRPPAQNPESTDPGDRKTRETEGGKHTTSDMASMDIKRYLRDLVDELKTEILNQVKQDMSRVIKEMLSGSISQDDTDGRREEHKKRRETFDKEYKENIEYMKQIQRDYQEIKNSIESWQNALKETKDRLSKLEDKFAMCDHERKDP